ncbi:hypothetical protein Tco_0633384 [Tanacetum coccineum]
MPEDPYAYVVAAFKAPPSSDYVSGLEYLPLPEFVPEPVYPEFMPPRNEEEPFETRQERRGLDDDVREEHPALADYVPPPVHRVTARISIRPQTPVSLTSNIEVARLLSIPTPPSSPISQWSSPLPQILSPPLPVSLPPTSPTYPLGYQASMIWLRAEAPSTSHSLPLPPPIILSHTRSDTLPSGTPPILPIPLPTSSPSLLLPSIDHRATAQCCFTTGRRRFDLLWSSTRSVRARLSATTDWRF